MSIRALFATRVSVSRLSPTQLRGLNSRLKRECLQLRSDDVAGRRWSKHSYPGGYTSYNSLCRMHEMSPTFARLRRLIDTRVKQYSAVLELDLRGKAMTMTDCWVNIMSRGVVHGAHLHPHSSISGTYYLQIPRGSAGLKLEDPRLDRFMAAPPKRARASIANRSWVTIPAVAGQLVLFESWLRHEVPPNPVAGERISISFNYSWF